MSSKLKVTLTILASTVLSSLLGLGLVQCVDQTFEKTGGSAARTLTTVICEKRNGTTITFTHVTEVSAHANDLRTRFIENNVSYNTTLPCTTIIEEVE
jgi:hypothetical protein